MTSLSSEVYFPLLKETDATTKCMDDNNYKKDMCTDYFLKYKNCRQFWVSTVNLLNFTPCFALCTFHVHYLANADCCCFYSNLPAQVVSVWVAGRLKHMHIKVFHLIVLSLLLDCESVFLQYMMFPSELESYISSNKFSFKRMQWKSSEAR